MKNVGILTIRNLNNYGNRLQAYALSKVIEKLNCTSVELITCEKINKQFVKDMIKTSSSLVIFFKFLAEIISGSKLKTAKKRCGRFRLFAQFSRKIKTRIILSDSKAFDYYVCGSDQIWNPSFAGESRYFAAFAAKEKRIAYAASFGISKLPEAVIGRYKKSLTNMNSISVRESAGRQIVKELTEREVQVVIDPTLMLDEKEWKAIAEKPKFKLPDNYILTYFWGNYCEETAEYVYKLAEENGLEIISLNAQEENDYWNGTGPSEFIWLIENAELVCTDSFHASVFSILLDSPFIVFRRFAGNNDMHSRIDNLLGMFQLTERFSENIQSGNEFKKEYQYAMYRLKAEREKATRFLVESLNLNR